MLEISDLSAGGNVGVIIAVLLAAASLLVVRFPFVSMIIFGAAGVTGIIAGFSTAFLDLLVWGVIALILCGVCFFARRKSTREAN